VRENGTHQVPSFESKEQQPKCTIKVEHVQKEYLLPTTDKVNIIAPSRGQCNDDEETWSRDGTSTGNQGEEDNRNAVDSSDDESGLARPFLIQNNTSTPQNSGTTPNNGFLATSQSRNGHPTEEDLMAAWNLVQRQQHQEPAQHNDQINGDNNIINAAGKRALSYRVAKQLQKKHVNTRIQGLVKTVIFRKCKFKTSKAHYNRVVTVVIIRKCNIVSFTFKCECHFAFQVSNDF
jgi:hypothetical protein